MGVSTYCVSLHSDLLQNHTDSYMLEAHTLSSPNSGLKSSFQHGVSYVGNFLGPLKNGFQQRLYQDSDGLRRLIRRELLELRSKLSPYMDEVHHKVSMNLEQLRSRLLPYTEELMDQVGQGAKDLHLQLGPYSDDIQDGATHRLAERFHDRIILHTAGIRQVFYPLAERLLAEIHHATEELRGNVAPHAQSSPEKLSQQVHELSRKLSQNARELHKKIHSNLEQLKEQLVSYPQELKRRFPEGQGAEAAPVAPYVEEMASQVQREVEEFRRNTQLQIEDFTRSIHRETEETQHRLTMASWDFQDSVSSVQDMQEKLDSLWRDISQSLS
ncbi:hypothetical protein FKM82_017683 [Ascaphus truei]